ncbi:MAG TPA: hypothetical protein VFG04_21750 [Planctomycetaceae bacterium]|nr:hypothetical protein [Planctomycetaceae bacterium]
MKILRAVIAPSVAAILVLGASACSAGGRYGWGSAGCCGGTGGYGCGGCGSGGGGEFGSAGGCGYGGCGAGSCGWGAAGGSTFWIVGDYTPYIIGHGPMFPAGESPHPAFWYDSLTGSDKSTTPSRK